MFHAILRHQLKPGSERAVERNADFQIEPTTNEGEAEWSAGLRGQFDADAARDAFARFENHTGWLADELELAAMFA